jgi:hypothetical protein
LNLRDIASVSSRTRPYYITFQQAVFVQQKEAGLWPVLSNSSSAQRPSPRGIPEPDRTLIPPIRAGTFPAWDVASRQPHKISPKAIGRPLLTWSFQATAFCDANGRRRHKLHFVHCKPLPQYRLHFDPTHALYFFGL